jgi:hypothetical protein
VRQLDTRNTERSDSLMRHASFTLHTIVLAAVFTLAAATAASAAQPPNPCGILPAHTLAVSFHGAVPASHLTVRHERGKTFRTCTWRQGKASLSVTTGPSYVLGGFGGPPGMIVTKPVHGLGSHSIYSHDDNPQFQFADVLFMRAPFSGDTHTNGNLPFVDILALARDVYRAE